MKQLCHYVLSITILIVSLFITKPFATETYVQKTVSGLETTLILPGINQTHYYKNHREINTHFHDALTLDRFQYAPLPPHIQTQFKRQLNTINRPSPKDVQSLITTYVLPTLRHIINSTANLQSRQRQLTQYDEKVTFAQVKGKSTALTADQLNIILNTAYIFVPYIKKSKTKINTKKRIVTSKLSGGVLWYHVDYHNNTAKATNLTHTVETETEYEINFLDSLINKEQTQQIITSAIYSAEKKAFTRLIDNLALKTRSLQSFKLSDQIIEADHNQYTIRIGKRENIQLDDTFYMYEWISNHHNQKKAKQVGFGYITKVGNNTNSTSEKSIFTQQLGSEQSIGGWIEEDARQKISLQIASSYQTNIAITPSNLTLKTNSQSITLINQSYNQAFGIKISSLYNIAKYTGISQLYGVLSLKGSILGHSETKKKKQSTNILTNPYLYSGHIGLKKKFWRKSQAITAKASIGADGLYLITSSSEYAINNIDIRTLGTEVEIGYEKLITPRLILVATVAKKWTLSNASFNYKIDGTNYTNSQSMDNFSLGGININAGVEFQF